MSKTSRNRFTRMHIRRQSLRSRNLASFGALATLLAALTCGIVGLLTTTILFETAVLLAISTGLAYVVVASRESTEELTAIKKAISITSSESNEAYMKMVKTLGKLTPIPEPDHVFRHASHALADRIGKGGWKRICLYAPAGVWMESKPKDDWLCDSIAAAKGGEVEQCWGVYGLPPKSEVAAWYAHGLRRLKLFIDAEGTELRYLPPDDARHPGAARGQGIIVLESYGKPADYITIFLFIGDNPRSRGGFMIEDRVIGHTMAEWFDSQAFHGCSANYLLRPLENYRGETPAQFMTRKLAEINARYYPEFLP